MFASTRRILWNLKIEKPKFFPPGQLCIADKSELNFQPVKQFENFSSTSLDFKSASKNLLFFFDSSISDYI